MELDGNALLIGREALHALHQSLTQDLGEQAAVRLQEAGHAGGASLYAVFTRWLHHTAGVADPGDLDADGLGEVLSAFFQEAGWGSVTVQRLGPAVLSVDAVDWGEANPAAGSPYPSCHFSSGLLGEFVGRLANQTVAVLEVECRSTQGSRCRFLLGAPETLEAVYQAISEGRDYAAVLTA